MLKRYIGDRRFYKRVLALAVPIMIQNGITNFVNMLDNIMVGGIGTNEMTGVATANQLIFVFNLVIFGAVSGAGIFGAQYFGQGDTKGVRNVFRFKIIFCTLMTVACIALFFFAGKPLMNLYLQGEGDPNDAIAALGYGWDYMKIMLVGLIPYAIVQCYSSTLRENDQTVPPMLAGVVAVVINLCFNYVLIYGKFGFPRLGAQGAALATVISRFVEFFIIIIYTRANSSRNKFIVGAYRSLYVPKALVLGIVKKGMPLMLNETMWAMGIATMNQCYSLTGYNTVAANNICQTFFNVFSVAFMAVGVAIGIMVGQLLGAEKTEEAKDTAIKLRAFSVAVSVLVGAIYFVSANYIAGFYNTTDEVKVLATALMRISALAMPLDAYAHASYFTLRSGGQVMITFLFDGCFLWTVSVPVAFILSRFVPIGIIGMYAICQSLNLIKDVLGYILVRRGSWAKKIATQM